MQKQLFLPVKVQFRNEKREQVKDYLFENEESLTADILLARIIELCSFALSTVRVFELSNEDQNNLIKEIAEKLPLETMEIIEALKEAV